MLGWLFDIENKFMLYQIDVHEVVSLADLVICDLVVRPNFESTYRNIKVGHACSCIYV